MTPDASERQILAELIRASQTLARQILAVHLGLGAVRAILARKGTVTETEFRAALGELDAMSSAHELLGAMPTTDEFFAELLRRLHGADDTTSAA
jgi:hypothetical protein